MEPNLPTNTTQAQNQTVLAENAETPDENDDEDENQEDTSLIVSKQSSKSKDLKILNQLRSFNSVRLKKKESGDYSKKAESNVKKPTRRLMNKIAMLETQVLTMKKRIEKLEAEKKEDRDQLQLLQTHSKK